MKNNIIHLLIISVLAVTANTASAQIYHAAATDALENNGREWVEKKLPPSVITFSDYSGQVEIKAPLSSLFAQNLDSASILPLADTLADFTMTLDKEQVQQQIGNGKTFTTTGNLVINNINKKTTAQCVLSPRNNPEDGFSIAVVIRFNPADYGMKVTGEPENTPLIVRVTSNYLNKFQSNF
jgi:hypothetical protein